MTNGKVYPPDASPGDLSHLKLTARRLQSPDGRLGMSSDRNTRLIASAIGEIENIAAPDCNFINKIAARCHRFMSLKSSSTTQDFLAASRAHAWFDATMILLQIELPVWSVRRIVRDDGRWYCSLSRCPQLPIELDDTVDTTHEHIALAVLLGLMQAKLRPVAEATGDVRLRNNPPSDTTRLCCENFA